MLASFTKVPNMLRPKASESAKNTFSITPLLYDASLSRDPREYPHKSYIARI